MLPIVAQYRAEPSPAAFARARRLAETLRKRQAALSNDPNLADLRPRRLRPAGVIHLDDMSTIITGDDLPEKVFLEERARLRASDGDMVITCTPSSAAFNDYCHSSLGLGDVEWLYATPRGSPRGVAVAAWTDRRVRTHLLHGVRQQGMRYIHPYMGNAAVWTLARLLRQASRRPVKVIAPPPELCSHVNDKTWFALVVRELFGERALPMTATVWNYSGLATVVRHMAESCRQLVIKLPDSAAGVGNVRLDAELFRRRPAGEVRATLKTLLPASRWHMDQRALVSGWQTDVIQTPSVHLWIPPVDSGLPVIEGLFEQFLEGAAGMFAGLRPAAMPEALLSEIVVDCTLLGVLFQHLGYIGRCSFDLILSGRSLDAARVEFIECNGRWGGASSPMSLMNRLFGDWRRRSFSTHNCVVTGLAGFSFGDVLAALRDDLYHHLTGDGHIVLLNASGIEESDRIDVLTLGADDDDAVRRAVVEIPGRLRSLVTRVGPGVPPTGARCAAGNCRAPRVRVRARIGGDSLPRSPDPVESMVERT